ncbi:hypothetical protein TNCV_516121 [Trichonephila clavipes]|nr:hypothetical protein TNCV_516121 [Trichonephila clavipes]
MVATPPISPSTISTWNWRGGEYSPVPCTRDSAHKIFGPTDLTRARTPCALGEYLVASSIDPKPSSLEFGALTTRLLTADDCWPHEHILQICHLLKTSGYGLARN